MYVVPCSVPIPVMLMSVLQFLSVTLASDRIMTVSLSMFTSFIMFMYMSMSMSITYHVYVRYMLVSMSMSIVMFTCCTCTCSCTCSLCARTSSCTCSLHVHSRSSSCTCSRKDTNTDSTEISEANIFRRIEMHWREYFGSLHHENILKRKEANWSKYFLSRDSLCFEVNTLGGSWRIEAYDLFYNKKNYESKRIFSEQDLDKLQTISWKRI